MKVKIFALVLATLFGCVITPLYYLEFEKEQETNVFVKSTTIESLEKQKDLNLDGVKKEEYPIDAVEARMNSELAKLDDIDNKKEWFLSYKEIIFKYIKWHDSPTTVFDVFSAEEVVLMCQTVETECYDQDFNYKVNVASVIFNRLESGRFGDTVAEIITNPEQFAYWRTIITEDSILAVMYAYEIGDTTDGALYFHSNDKTDTFCGADYLFTDDIGHHFYK